MLWPDPDGVDSDPDGDDSELDGVDSDPDGVDSKLDGDDSDPTLEAKNRIRIKPLFFCWLQLIAPWLYF